MLDTCTILILKYFSVLTVHSALIIETAQYSLFSLSHKSLLVIGDECSYKRINDKKQW